MAPNTDYELFTHLPSNLNGPTDDFFWMNNEEPHASRRKLILKKYPKVQELFGYEPRTKYIVTLLVIAQIYLAHSLSNSYDKWYFYAAAYVLGGTINHALFLAIHEISHNLAFKTLWPNRLLAMFGNLPIGLPYYSSFKVYHNEHHKYQGVDTVDTDLPTNLEGKIFRGTIRKAFFCLFVILFYVFRPLFVRPKPVSGMIALNFAIQLSFNAALVYFSGIGALGYLILSTFWAGTIHPCAGHFLAEHFVFVEGVETYSYYGPLNYVCFNVGYHNEHHDFPNIPWSRLPLLKKLAPDFYDNLPYHSSWVMVIWKYITDPRVTSFNRIKRKPKQEMVDSKDD